MIVFYCSGFMVCRMASSWRKENLIQQKWTFSMHDSLISNGRKLLQQIKYQWPFHEVLLQSSLLKGVPSCDYHFNPWLYGCGHWWQLFNQTKVWTRASAPSRKLPKVKNKSIQKIKITQNLIEFIFGNGPICVSILYKSLKHWIK